MGPTETGLIIVAVVVVMAAVAFTIQAIENQRRERRMRLLILKDQIRRADHLLHTLPEHYITAEIRDLLVAYLQSRWKQVLVLDNTQENQKKLSDLENLASKPLPVVEHPEGSLTLHPDRSQAERTAALLRELYQFLMELQKGQVLFAAAARDVLAQVKEAYIRTRIDVEIMEALEVERHRGAAPALPRYRTVASKLQRLNRTQQLDRQIYELSAHMDKLEAIAQRERQQREEEERRRREEEGKEDSFQPGQFTDFRL